jgi:primase-polymerase (primpol)-like protein
MTTSTDAGSSAKVIPVPENIPAILRERPQWVCWRYVARDGKPTKVPYSPSSFDKASSTDLMTWASFDDALAALTMSDFDGIGFVFCSADPFVGIDLDGCRNAQTGEVEEWARKILQSFENAVHVEVSPSGKGVHLITRGVRKNGVNTKHVEIYGQDRFFTITGVAL